MLTERYTTIYVRISTLEVERRIKTYIYLGIHKIKKK